MAEENGIRCKGYVIDIAVERLVQRVNKLCHAAGPPPRFVASMTMVRRKMGGLQSLSWRCLDAGDPAALSLMLTVVSRNHRNLAQQKENDAQRMTLKPRREHFRQSAEQLA